MRFVLETKKRNGIRFPLYLRIPAWCKEGSVKINGTPCQNGKGNTVVKIDREWKSGDAVTLELPMRIRKNTWQQNSVSIQRGPLTYALKIAPEKKLVTNTQDPVENGSSYYEIRPLTPWNYGLPDFSETQLNEHFKVEQSALTDNYPWTLATVPISIKATGKRFKRWQLYNESAGPLPYSVTYGLHLDPEDSITLVPYGATQLRVAQFPVY
ncbi:hypothetical protein [Niabella agricola]|uniref:hypothetical protein n=1 Tax=Niabella agricola TaxID=2891571 RepID=UPI0038738D2F